MHSVSSSEDIKPPFGLRPMQSHSPGIMLSQKRLCVICGDRSSGKRTLKNLCLHLFHLLIACMCYSQANTMEFTAVRAAKAFSNGLCARTWATPAGTIKSAWSTNASAIAASTAATRSAWPWAWRGKVCNIRILILVSIHIQGSVLSKGEGSNFVTNCFNQPLFSGCSYFGFEL